MLMKKLQVCVSFSFSKNDFVGLSSGKSIDARRAVNTDQNPQS
jgi:hypothetical protein